MKKEEKMETDNILYRTGKFRAKMLDLTCALLLDYGQVHVPLHIYLNVYSNST